MNRSRDLRLKPLDVLEKELCDSERELVNLRLQNKKGSRVQKPHLFNLVKRRIARLKCILHEERRKVK